MSIYDSRQTYLKLASVIHNYDKISCTELANKYIEKKNSLLADNYFAALIINNWSTIYKLKSSVLFCKNITCEDCYDWLVQGILAVLKDKKWLDKSSSLYQDPNAFDKMLTIAISHIRISSLKYLSRKCRIGDNYTCSLDEMKENIGFDFPYTDSDTSNTDYIVQYYIDHDRIFDALLVDLICYGDTQVYDQRLKRLKFSPIKLSSNLSLLNNKYIETFVNKYNNVCDQHLIDIRNWVNETESYTVARKIRTTFKKIRDDLCNNKDLNKNLIV